MAALTDAQTHGLFRALGHPELCADPRFETLALRMQHLEELLELTSGTADARRAYLCDFKNMIDTVRRISKPVIAAVHGACVGGGNELNIACDLTIASENAKFGQAGPKVGSMPAFGVPQNLQILVGEKRSGDHLPLSALYCPRSGDHGLDQQSSGA